MLKNISRIHKILALVIVICISSVCVAWNPLADLFGSSGGNNPFGGKKNQPQTASSGHAESKNNGQKKEDATPTKQDTTNIEKLFKEATYEKFESHENAKSEGIKIFDEDLLRQQT